MKDIPSKINLQDVQDARDWAERAMILRPYRITFFDLIAKNIGSSNITASKVLEIGSGPGFLAEHLLKNNQRVMYEALDFSEAMHALARERLGSLSSKVKFHLSDFKEKNLHRGFEQYDVIVTVQAVHEVRHKDYVPGLFRSVRGLLAKGGSFLYCDHFYGQGGMNQPDLYMSVQEQEQALNDCFSHVSKIYSEGTLILWKAKC